MQKQEAIKKEDSVLTSKEDDVRPVSYTHLLKSEKGVTLENTQGITR